MPRYRIADFLFDIEPRYPLLRSVCEKYRVDTAEKPDYTVHVTDEDIAAVTSLPEGYQEDYGESLSACRAVCMYATSHGALMLHAAVIEVEGKAYAFCAPSGTGKSTHISLWRRRFGKRVQIINGDKPLLREKNGVFTVYGTPWCGKEGWNRNASAPLAGICFLARATENSIERLTPAAAIEPIFRQLLKPKDAPDVARTLHLADLILSTVPVYRLGCNVSEEAAEVAYGTMIGEPIPPKEQGEVK